MIFVEQKAGSTIHILSDLILTKDVFVAFTGEREPGMVSHLQNIALNILLQVHTQLV